MICYNLVILLPSLTQEFKKIQCEDAPQQQKKIHKTVKSKENHKNEKDQYQTLKSGLNSETQNIMMN